MLNFNYIILSCLYRTQPQASTNSSQPQPISLSNHPSGARAKQRQRLTSSSSSSATSVLNYNAKEYKPQSDSYRAVLSGIKDICLSKSDKKNLELCPYTEKGGCPFQGSCQYIHGDLCELCGIKFFFFFNFFGWLLFSCIFFLVHVFKETISA